jgi:DNA-binding NarL/FixJ family response regulator
MGAAEGAPGSGAIRCLLVDDHEVVRVGLRAVLSAAPDVRVVAEAGTAAEAVRMAAELHPDVAVMDVRLPDGSGIEACRDIRGDWPETRVLILSAYSDEEALFSAILAGAAGYLLKQARGSEVLQAVRAVHAGGSLLDPAVTARVLQRLRAVAAPRPADPTAELTALDRRILDMLADGRTNREIASALFVSETTAKHYVSGILRKLEVTRRSEAAAVWARARPV